MWKNLVQRRFNYFTLFTGSVTRKIVRYRVSRIDTKYIDIVLSLGQVHTWKILETSHAYIYENEYKERVLSATT